MNTIIQAPALYIDSLPYDPAIKLILHQVARFRLAGNRAQMSWRRLQLMINRSHTTLAKVMNSQQFRDCIKRKRRGKKQTNEYFLQYWLWDRLTKGRIKRRVEKRSETKPLPASRAPSRLLELFKAELGQAAAPLP